MLDVAKAGLEACGSACTRLHHAGRFDYSKAAEWGTGAGAAGRWSSVGSGWPGHDKCKGSLKKMNKMMRHVR